MFPYALTIFLSAFLLFQVQPLVAKMILPWFGGSAAVWTVCLLFFQGVLLLGYFYAWGLSRFVAPRRQLLIHALLLALSLLLLPIIPGQHWKPNGTEDPALAILALLAATVGLPYLLVSSTSPLLQSWFARSGRGAFPYRLFALSNAGSLLALLSYPVAVEPFLPTRTQAIAWSVGFALFAVVCVATGFISVKRDEGKAGRDDSDAPPASAADRILWLALSACSCILLMAVTNHLCQNVAAIPFLWVLPLALYLITFIVCFEREKLYRRAVFLPVAAIALGGMAYLSFEEANGKLWLLLPAFSAGLFVCCMFCHGELARLKPHPRYLTTFYLMSSLGGAIGGTFVGLLAPRIFTGYFELQAGLLLCALLAVTVVLRLESPLRRWSIPASVAGTAVLAIYLVCQTADARKDARVAVRNFYGGLLVADEGTGEEQYRKLIHGTINHGLQYLRGERRGTPTSYYCEDSGAGLAIRATRRDAPQRVGVIGLGTGTLACYARRGDFYRFYDINPLVVQLAKSEFSYVPEARGTVDVALGDARLSLERENPNRYDVLVVDAFSSDSIPVHLLTQEAFRLYFSHLSDRGILAVHVSNKYLDLEPVVGRLASSLGKDAILVESEDDDENGIFGASWVLVANDRRTLQHPLLKEVAAPLPSKPGLKIWTDDYSNLYSVLK